MDLACCAVCGAEGVPVVLAAFVRFFVFVTLTLRVEVPLPVGFLALPLDAPALEFPSPLS